MAATSASSACSDPASSVSLPPYLSACSVGGNVSAAVAQSAFGSPRPEVVEGAAPGGPDVVEDDEEDGRPSVGNADGALPPRMPGLFSLSRLDHPTTALSALLLAMAHGGTLVDTLFGRMHVLYAQKRMH